MREQDEQEEIDSQVRATQAALANLHVVRSLVVLQRSLDRLQRGDAALQRGNACLVQSCHRLYVAAMDHEL